VVRAISSARRWRMSRTNKAQNVAIMSDKAMSSGIRIRGRTPVAGEASRSRAAGTRSVIRCPASDREVDRATLRRTLDARKAPGTMKSPTKTLAFGLDVR
jgi:hypothetical protein